MLEKKKAQRAFFQDQKQVLHFKVMSNILILANLLSSQCRETKVQYHLVTYVQVFVSGNGFAGSLISFLSACMYGPAASDCADQLCRVSLNPCDYHYHQQSRQHPPFPRLQDCQVSPVVVGFGRRLAVKLRQAGSCSIHHILMTFIDKTHFCKCWD